MKLLGALIGCFSHLHKHAALLSLGGQSSTVGSKQAASLATGISRLPQILLQGNTASFVAEKKLVDIKFGKRVYLLKLVCTHTYPAMWQLRKYLNLTI